MRILRWLSLAVGLVCAQESLSAQKPQQPRRPGIPAGVTPGAAGATVHRPRASGVFRVTLNGFRVVRPTWDHALNVDGQGDEVFIVSNAWVSDTLGATGRMG